METVQPASANVFRLRFHKSAANDIALEASGALSTDGNKIKFRFGRNRQLVAWREPHRFVVQTLCRNSVPLYIREIKGEVWISNDVAELVVEGETLSVRPLEVIAAAKYPHLIKSVWSHLFDEIRLLLPASLYVVRLNADGTVKCVWNDVVFEDAAVSREDLLDLIVEKYRDALSPYDEVCLALSGGYDSRFELSLLAHLNKKIHCFHYERLHRESRLASKIAETGGASFQVSPIREAACQGWLLLRERGYVTRWDGYFSAGALPSAGIYAAMERFRPWASKHLMMTGTLRGRLYSRANGIFDFWRELERRRLAGLSMDHPEFQQIVDDACERRCQTIRELEAKIRTKTDRTDIMTDISYNFLYRSVGKVATRVTFLFENGMPTITADQGVRDRFSTLPIRQKRDEAFLAWATGRLHRRLARLPWISSSVQTLERQFGFVGRLPIARTVLSRYRIADIGDHSSWVSEGESERIFVQLPELRSAVAQAGRGNSRLYVSMILNFLATLQDRKSVSYRLS
jgi:hypothetical protein